MMEGIILWFTEFVLEFLLLLPGWLCTLVIATLPIFELRGSLPVALGIYEMTWWKAYLISVTGNMIPVPLILVFLKYVVPPLRKYSIPDRFFGWLFERTRKKAGDKMLKYEGPALFIFVAIPFPITGAWTGAIASWLFGVKFKKALVYIFMGVLTAGLVVSLIWNFANWLLETSVWAFLGSLLLLALLYMGYWFINRSNGATMKMNENSGVGKK